MNPKEMMKLESGDVVAVKYDDTELPVIEVIKQSPTKTDQYIKFESGESDWSIADTLLISRICKIGHVKKTFEFD